MIRSTSILAIFCFSSIAAAQVTPAQVTPAQETTPAEPAGTNTAKQENQPDDATILVEGNRRVEAKSAGKLVKTVTRHIPGNQTFPKYYVPICMRFSGLDDEYAKPMEKLIIANLKQLNFPVGRRGCRPNILISFIKDSHSEVTRLRKDKPGIFDGLSEQQIDDILAGNKAAQAWNFVSTKNVDGLSFTTGPIAGVNFSGLGGIPPTNRLYNPSKRQSTIRSEINGAILLFDNTLSNGYTIQQLADYATFRIIAPVTDINGSEVDQPNSILSLFSKMDPVPSRLTEFDWTYLSAARKLNIRSVTSISTATRRAYVRGDGLQIIEAKNRETVK